MIDRAAISTARQLLVTRPDFLRTTPLMRLPGRALGVDCAEVWLKLEQTQVGGSFKARGMLYRLLANPVPDSGVIIASGGNAGIAVAAAARALGVRCEVFVPEVSPEAKRARLRSLGAEVVVTGAAYSQALEACVARQKATGALQAHAYDLGMPLVADHDELIALFGQLGHLNVHLAHQRAGGIKDGKATVLGLLLHRAAHAVGAENQGGPGRHVRQRLDEDRALGLEVIDHIRVVHDFMAHIDGRAKLLQRALDDLNGAVNASTKAARLGQEDFLRSAHHKIPITWTSNVTGWPASGWLKSNSTAPSSRTCCTAPA